MGPLASLVAVNVQGNNVPKVIDFMRYYTKFSGENEILRGVLRIVSNFSLHFVLYIGNLNSFLDRCEVQRSHHQQSIRRGKFAQWNACQNIGEGRLMVPTGSKGLKRKSVATW